LEVRNKEVLNADEAAEFLGFNPYTVREKARLGEIPGRKIGREWRFSREALLEWLKDGQAPRHKGPVVVLTPNP
jgi:excisionase family DNA binding protein